jgi:hypothetical protein
MPSGYPANANWDIGSSIAYPGIWGARMVLRVSCLTPLRPFDPTLTLAGSVVTYTTSMSGPTWTFNVSSAFACPRPYDNPPTPSASRPPPPPSPTVQTSFDETVNDRHWHLDLADLQATTQMVIIAHRSDYWYKSEFHYSPLDRRGCPNGKNCGNYANDMANVWECGDQGTGDCFPVGDRAYGLTIQLINESLETSGINVTYFGGAANYTIEFSYYCNDTLAPGEIVLFEVGDDTSAPYNLHSHDIRVHAETVEVCDLPPGPGPVPGPIVAATAAGTVFIFVLVVLLVLYVGIGTLIVYARTGAVSLPNETFWREVFKSVADGAAFLLTCGDKRPSGPIYDRI